MVYMQKLVRFLSFRYYLLKISRVSDSLEIGPDMDNILRSLVVLLCSQGQELLP